VSIAGGIGYFYRRRSPRYSDARSQNSTGWRDFTCMPLSAVGSSRVAFYGRVIEVNEVESMAVLDADLFRSVTLTPAKLTLPLETLGPTGSTAR